MPSTAKVIPLHQPSFSGKMPRKPKNKDVRSREYLTDKEVEALMKAARNTGRHAHPGRLPPWVPGVRGSLPSLGPNRPRPGTSARRQAEERRGLDDVRRFRVAVFLGAMSCARLTEMHNVTQK